jgi:hypothetical protein
LANPENLEMCVHGAGQQIGERGEPACDGFPAPVIVSLLLSGGVGWGL